MKKSYILKLGLIEFQIEVIKIAVSKFTSELSNKHLQKAKQKC